MSPTPKMRQIVVYILTRLEYKVLGRVHIFASDALNWTVGEFWNETAFSDLVSFRVLQKQ